MKNKTGSFGEWLEDAGPPYRINVGGEFAGQVLDRLENRLQGRRGPVDFLRANANGIFLSAAILINLVSIWIGLEPVVSASFGKQNIPADAATVYFIDTSGSQFYSYVN